VTNLNQGKYLNGYLIKLQEEELMKKFKEKMESIKSTKNMLEINFLNKQYEKKKKIEEREIETQKNKELELIEKEKEKRDKEVLI